MKTTLADFEPLRPAEKQLVEWLQAGNRKVFVLSENVPEGPSDDVILRATFLRYLALGGCEDCCLPETGLQVAGAYIEGNEESSDSTKGLDLEGTTLPRDVNLWKCHVPDPIILRSAQVKNLFFNNAKLSAGIVADRMYAEGGIFLRHATVTGEIQLLSARIGSSLDLEQATLCADQDEMTAKKSDALSCDGIRVEGTVFLSGATVTGEIRLLGARIEGDLACNGATLRAEGTALRCDSARISGAFFLRDRANVTGAISLTAASLNAISDDPCCWPNGIRLDRCRYEAFLGIEAPTDANNRLDWLARIPSEVMEFWPDPYEHCAKVLREMGHGADAREILIEKERLQRKARRERIARDLEQARRDRDTTDKQDGLRVHTDRVIGHWLHLTGLRLWDGILGVVVGYGRKPQNAAWWGLAMWLIGFLVFANAAGHGAIKPNLPQIQLNPAWVSCADDRRGQLDCFLNHSDAASYPRFNAFIYSADTLIPVVSLEMQSYWIPDDRTTRGMLARGYLWFHIAMGWALTLLAVAGFSGLIKTDNTK